MNNPDDPATPRQLWHLLRVEGLLRIREQTGRDPQLLLGNLTKRAASNLIDEIQATLSRLDELDPHRGG